MSEIKVEKHMHHNKYIEYQVKGELFFASTQSFINSFDYTDDIKDIDFSQVKIWDESAVDATDKVIIKFHKNGVKTNLIGLSDSCLNLIDKMGVHNKIGGLGVIK